MHHTDSERSTHGHHGPICAMIAQRNRQTYQYTRKPPSRRIPGLLDLHEERFPAVCEGSAGQTNRKSRPTEWTFGFSDKRSKHLKILQCMNAFVFGHVITADEEDQYTTGCDTHDNMNWRPCCTHGRPRATRADRTLRNSTIVQNPKH